MQVTQSLHRAAQLEPYALATIFGDRRHPWRKVIRPRSAAGVDTGFTGP
jgi:hypothetical protein